MFLTALGKFLRETELHGLRHIADRRHIVVRGAWLVAILGCLGFLIYYCINRFVYHSTYPVAIRMSMSSTHMSLPAITILHSHEIRLDKVTARDLRHVGYLYFGLDNHSISSSDQVLFGNNRTQRILQLDQEMLTLPSNGREEEFDFKEFLYRAGHQLNDIFLSCEWFDGVNEETNCLTVTNFTRGLIWPFGNSYTLNSGGELVLRSSGYSPKLRLRLNLDLSHSTGVERRGKLRHNRKTFLYLIIHNQNNMPLTGALPLTVFFRSLDPYVTADYSVNLFKSAQIQRLPKPYSQCNKSHEYSRYRCIGECVAATFYENMGCVLYDMIRAGGVYPVCLQAMVRYAEVRKKRYMAYRICQGDKDRCLEACIDYHYDYELESIAKSYKNNFMTVDLRAPDRLVSELIEEVSMYTLESLLGELGGMASLFLGISILTILHLLEFIITQIIESVRCNTKV